MLESRKNIMRQAVAEAEKQLLRIGVNYQEPLDIFKIINEMGIILMFRPLEGKTDGFYLPKTIHRPKAGILVNSQRPYTRQRYTAAHELCHYIEKDSARIEVISEGCAQLPLGRSKGEIFAESFAEHFLMPAKLVTYFFRKLGLKKGNLNEKDIYKLALFMRTSYEATCNHLLNLEFIFQNQHSRLIKIPPKKIKSTWASDLGHNDVWPIDNKMQDFCLLPLVDDIIQISLPETPSTGYIWRFKNGKNEILMEESSTLHFNNPEEHVGQTGERVLIFRVVGHGKERLKVCLNRPWKNEDSIINEFGLQINSTEADFIGVYDKEQFLMAA